MSGVGWKLGCFIGFAMSHLKPWVGNLFMGMIFDLRRVVKKSPKT
jgi:hypothetical protein